MSRRLVVLAVLAACGHHDRAPQATTLAISVTADGKPAAARVLLIDAAGKPWRAGTIDLYGARQGATACAIATGVTATWAGIIVAKGVGDLPVGGDATCSPPYGRYHVIAWQGIEHERWEGDVDLAKDRGRVALPIVLERAWAAPGWVAADLHVHALGSNDSNMPLAQRVAAQAAAGIQVSALTNHNAWGTFAPTIQELGMEDVIRAVPAVELTAEGQHANVYPVKEGLDAAGAVKLAPAAFFALARSFAPFDHAAPIVQLNHPRFRVTALFDGVGWNGVAWPPPFPNAFDAVETINGFTAFDLTTDPRISDGFRDLYTLTDHGWLVAPMGNSDTHDFNWVHDGLARTYVRLAFAAFTPDAFADAIRARHTIATTGPWLDVGATGAPVAPTASGPGDLVAAAGGKVHLHVEVAHAKFMHLDRLRIVVGGVEKIVPLPDQRSFVWESDLDVGAVDTWIGVDVLGRSPMPLEQTGTYQVEKWKHPGDMPAAIISPILVDADADGQWHRGDTNLTP